MGLGGMGLGIWGWGYAGGMGLGVCGGYGAGDMGLASTSPAEAKGRVQAGMIGQSDAPALETINNACRADGQRDPKMRTHY